MSSVSLCALVAAALCMSACAPRAVDVTDLSPAGSQPVSVPGVPAQNAEATAVLNGTVTGGAALPEGASVTVRIEDVSRADAPAGLIAEDVIQLAREFPVVFSVAYAPSRIDVRKRYGVRVSVRDAGGVLLWTTTTFTPVFTQGAPIDGVEVAVERVAP